MTSIKNRFEDRRKNNLVLALFLVLHIGLQTWCPWGLTNSHNVKYQVWGKMDEQQLGGGNNWQDSHPALQSSHARGALFFYSQISCLVFLSPPFICYSYFFTDSFFCFLLVSSYLIFYSSHSLICFVLPLFLQYDNFLRAQRSHGRFRGNQRWTSWRWELNLKSCKK